MPLIKPSIAACSCGSLCSSLSSSAIITSPVSRNTSTGSSSTSSASSPSSPPLLPLRRRKLWPALRTQWKGTRNYATINENKHGEQCSEPASPAWPTAKNPTPYDIFAQSRHAPYSKKTFYQLVKLYHPDHHAHTPSSDNISDETRLERYRLVITANAILSNPAKKRSYDLYGAGWGSQSDMSNESWREMDRAWRQRPNSAAYNATWEDWERWRDESDGDKRERQHPVYMSNGLFVASLAVFVVIGSWSQATRAGSNSARLIEMREINSSHISEDMWRKRQEKAFLTREDRVESFLRQREGWGHGAMNESHLPKDCKPESTPK